MFWKVTKLLWVVCWALVMPILIFVTPDIEWKNDRQALPNYDKEMGERVSHDHVHPTRSLVHMVLMGCVAVWFVVVVVVVVVVVGWCWLVVEDGGVHFPPVEVVVKESITHCQW